MGKWLATSLFIFLCFLVYKNTCILVYKCYLDVYVIVYMYLYIQEYTSI